MIHCRALVIFHIYSTSGDMFIINIHAALNIYIPLINSQSTISRKNNNLCFAAKAKHPPTYTDPPLNTTFFYIIMLHNNFIFLCTVPVAYILNIRNPRVFSNSPSILCCFTDSVCFRISYCGILYLAEYYIFITSRSI
jgi:hypothetical protein